MILFLIWSDILCRDDLINIDTLYSCLLHLSIPSRLKNGKFRIFVWTFKCDGFSSTKITIKSWKDLFWTKKVEYRADSVTLPLLQLAKQVKIWDFWYFAFKRKLAKTKWEIIELSGKSTHVQPWTSWVVLSRYRWDFHTFYMH